jgi:Relaxase/Mobilisation nuclease domain
MAIGNITKGRGFGGLLDYLLDPKKQPKIISGCVVNHDPSKLAREFRAVSNLRPNVRKPVRHFSIAFAPEDGVVDNVIKEAIAFQVLDGLGYADCQFIAIDHHRADPGHDEIHDHDHMHIVTNAVTVHGKYVRDSYDRFKIQTILRKAEKYFELREIKSSWEVKQEKAEAVDRESDIAQNLAETLANCPNLQTWLSRLEQLGIDVRFNLSKTDRVMGVTFLQDGEAYKGSEIGVKWAVVNERVPITVGDIDLMKATNLNTQTKPVRLSEIDRAMFDRTIEMAVMKLERGDEFENNRAKIKLDGDTLRVMRMRPHKLMVAAIRGEDGKWEPIGLPNIQKKDVELLERMNGTPTQIFEPSPQVAFELTEAELRSISMDKLLYCVPPIKEKSIAVQSTVTVESELSI